MEYTKQLILSCLLNICQKLSPDGGRIPKGMYFVGRISLDIHVFCSVQNVFDFTCNESHYCTLSSHLDRKH